MVGVASGVCGWAIETPAERGLHAAESVVISATTPPTESTTNLAAGGVARAGEQLLLELTPMGVQDVKESPLHGLCVLCGWFRI